MSRTDKDRPYWVVNYQDGNGRIDHDHRNGECIEETLEVAKIYNGGGYRYGHHHYRDCAKRLTREWTCTKSDPFTSAYRYGGLNRQECWTWRCRCDVPRWRRHFTPYGALYNDGYRDACPTWGRVQCDGHSETYRDDSINCVCDTWPERPTCDFARVPDSKGGYSRYTWGGVPTEYVRRMYHRPERARERKLNNMAREYNAYGDIEDADFINRQARNEARWWYW